jgi:hypothetical protein
VAGNWVATSGLFNSLNMHKNGWFCMAVKLGLNIALMMESASTSEMSVNFYQTTLYNNPEDSLLYTRRRENLKSHLVSTY